MREPRGCEAPNVMNNQYLKGGAKLESRTFISVGSTQWLGGSIPIQRALLGDNFLIFDLSIK